MKKFDIFIAFILVIVIVVGLAMFTPVLAERRRLQDEVTQLLQQQAAVRHQLALLQKEIDALSQGDPKAIMRVARERFNYCLDGEEIYQFDYSTQEK